MVKAFRCLHCKWTMGVTDGRRLQIGVSGGAYVDETTALRCGSCGARRQWKPIKISIGGMEYPVIIDEEMPPDQARLLGARDIIVTENLECSAT